MFEAKEEIIGNLKMIIEQLQKEICKQVTGDVNPILSNANVSSDQLTPGVADCIDFLKCHANNGIILNGLLIGVWVQRRTTADNIWKSQAVKKFTSTEITASKDELWEIAVESVLGKIVKRQGTSKSITEINDICVAFNKLAENETLPMFIGTGEMILLTPVFNVDSEKIDNGIIANRLKVLEESVSSMIEKFQGNTNSHTDDNMMTSSLASLEEAICRLIPDSTDKSICSSLRDNQGVLNDMNNPEEKNNTLTTSAEKEKRILNRMEVSVDEKDNVINGPSWTEVVRGGRRTSSTLSKLHTPTALTNNSSASKNGENRSENWRQDLSLLTGTAVSNDRNMTLSPDVDLVAYGVAKNVTALQLSKFVQDRGVDLLDCTQLTKFVQDRGVDLLDCTQLTKFVQDRGVDLLDCTQLTKFEGTRSLAFKVTIKPNDFEKCMNAEVWPYGVGLRRFKHFIPRQSSLREDRPKSSKYKDGQIRRIHDDELTMQNHIGTRDNRFRKVRFEEDALRARNA